VLTASKLSLVSGVDGMLFMCVKTTDGQEKISEEKQEDDMW
jgi:hypothetical protein